MANENDANREYNYDRPPKDPDAQNATGGDQPAGPIPSQGENTPNDWESHGNTGNTEAGGEWASQENYQEQTGKTTDVVVPDGNQRFRVQRVPPLKFASIVEEYGIDDLAADLQQVPENATMDDDLGEVFQMIGMFRDVVVPNVVRPRNAHWANPPSDPDTVEVFDLSQLTEDDILTLIAAITDQDAEELINDGRSKARAQNRGQPENQRFR